MGSACGPLIAKAHFSRVFDLHLFEAEEPAHGTLTRYGLPVHKNQSFTYYEMANGFVKYVRGAEAQPDSFKVKVLDYLDCMILDPVVVTVQ